MALQAVKFVGWGYPLLAAPLVFFVGACLLHAVNPWVHAAFPFLGGNMCFFAGMAGYGVLVLSGQGVVAGPLLIGAGGFGMWRQWVAYWALRTTASAKESISLLDALSASSPAEPGRQHGSGQASERSSRRPARTSDPS
ncbi:hypothetical protein [Cryptosporangium minutisporangium]|uniref:Uncharacterized protein n=1 Tax=Cryptosporangium minutisporangium TaxID=113569 RepID=A0ABP6SZY2_9ACTN